MTAQSRYPVDAVHNESGARFTLKPRNLDALISQEQSFLKTYHHDYGFECQCHNPAVKMHIKKGEREEGAFFWLADNPNTPEHDPLCELFKVKVECCKKSADLWDIPQNIIATAENPSKNKSRSTTGKTKTPLLKRPSVLKRLTHRLLSESLALYNFGNKHSLGYLALKAKESNFAKNQTLEKTPVSDVLFSDRKGLVFLKSGLEKNRFRAGLLLLTGDEVSFNDRWLTIDGEYYPLTGIVEKVKGEGPYLVVMLWTGNESPVIRSAYIIPVVHQTVMLPVISNTSRKTIIKSLKEIQKTRTPENKRYLRINLLPQDSMPNAFISEVVNDSRQVTPLMTFTQNLESTC